MSFQNKLTLLMLLLAFLSCKEAKKTVVAEIRINTDSIKNNFDLSSIAKNISVLPLKEQSGIYIGEVSKVFKLDKKIIIFDRLRSKRIVVFDDKGNFVAKPTEVARSQNDPMQLNDCWINSNGELEVYDFSTKKIFKYGHDFKLKSVVQSSYDRIFTAMLDDGNNGYVGFKGYTPYNSDREKKNYKLATLKKDLAMDEMFMHYNDGLNDALLPNTNSPLQRIDDDIIIIEAFSNSIMAINKGELLEKYKILYSSKPLIDTENKILVPNRLLLTDKNPDFNKIYSLFKGYYGFNGGWQETKNFIIIQSFDPLQKVFYSIYDKGKRKVIANAYNLTFDNGKSILPPFMTTSFKADEFFAVYPGYTLKPIISKESTYGNSINSNLETNYAIALKLN